MSGMGMNVRWSLCRFQCKPSVFHSRSSSAEDTSSGGRSINASGSLLAHFLRAKPPVFISSLNLWMRCQASSTPSQLVAKSLTYISDNTLSVSASIFPRRCAWCLTTCMARNGEHVRPNPTRVSR
ncbi:hypothetical protein T07_14067 [Trichinella nelsoni]|uniref:Uncharacterized protein n=1 Tax=Trichinella nelsoni TaxID=6336 RepID=A0A0V0RDM9_9BILA|nr:hypothetical protein T07_8218 [Trichinella nelsoni]KRX12532.1 hypothetical protein T07_14067 [Trichinella nelsoni]